VRRAGSPRALARPSLAALALTGSLAACGASPPDLFAVQRTGTVPGARLTLVVSDNGGVRCNGSASRQLTDSQLLAARQLQRDLDNPAKHAVTLAPTPLSVFTYSVTTPSGSLRFSDTSPGITPVFQRVAAFTHEVATGVCHLPR
jgi:hypothetical protein